MTGHDQELRRITIPFPTVSAEMLSKVTEYWKKHPENREFDPNFVKEDTPTLLDLTLAAHYFKPKDLFDFLTCTLSNRIMTMSNN